ncbi:MAG: hypothetical protein C5B52_15525 [Bacteroidetes bacterium]|nr:MAG: hypothetical protein C5B52_15525 [Bacteroidota bacterium]
MDDQRKINKFLPVGILYFFFNSFLLPQGMLYTTILTPLFLIWLYRYPIFNYVWLFFIVSVPFMIVHLLNGVNFVYYFRSYFLLFSVFVFGMAFYQFLKNCKNLPSIFEALLIINIFLLGLAVIALPIPSLVDRFWYTSPITTGINESLRLKLLTYEPSYYSILFVPIAIYYYLKMLLIKAKGGFLIFFLVTLPLILSLSFGIIMGLILSICFLYLSDVRLFTLKRNFPKYLLSVFLLALFVFAMLVVFYPDNILFHRLSNVFIGKDTSFKGRTFDSFYLGWQIASYKSILFGSGPGQTKLLGLQLFIDFYETPTFTQDQVTIPNSLGDILATYGILGVVIKLMVEIYLFFKTKVYSNLYRLCLFLFVMIYQFTGSYITNIAEYVIWIMAFSSWIFTEFDKSKIFGKRLSPIDSTSPALTN